MPLTVPEQRRRVPFGVRRKACPGRLAFMDRREERYDAKGREASKAGLLIGLGLIVLAFAFIFALFAWGPAVVSVAPVSPQSEAQTQE